MGELGRINIPKINFIFRIFFTLIGCIYFYYHGVLGVNREDMPIQLFVNMNETQKCNSG